MLDIRDNQDAKKWTASKYKNIEEKKQIERHDMSPTRE